MGVAPEPPGDSDRTAWGVVSDPSRVRLKDLVFRQLDIFSRGSWYPVRGDLIQGCPNWGLTMDQDPSNACALDFGSFMDPPSVGLATELLGPWRAKIEKIFVTCLP